MAVAGGTDVLVGVAVVDGGVAVDVGVGGVGVCLCPMPELPEANGCWGWAARRGAVSMNTRTATRRASRNSIRVDMRMRAPLLSKGGITYRRLRMVIMSRCRRATCHYNRADVKIVSTRRE